MKIVQDNKSIKNLCKILKKQKNIYIDTEFLRDRTYWPLLCTIQIRTLRNSYLIDMISKSEMDFTDFKKILKNNKITKVIHSSKQDIEVIFYKFNLIMWPVFDTQLAFGMIGNNKSVSYNNLVEMYFKNKISKKYQQSNWQKRPLSLSQLNYAENDVKYLPGIYKILIEQIRKKKLVRKTHIEFEKLKSVIDVYDVKKSYQRIKLNNISKSNNLLLKKFSKWREENAQKFDLPRNWIISDKIIIHAIKKRYSKIKKTNNKNKNLNSKIEEFKKYLEREKFI